MTIDFETAPPPDVDVLCPLCEYNLRGLAIARCPECGASFDWAELRDPARKLHPYLFEHHPERNVWSFICTLLAGLQPKRFWQTLNPSQPSRPKRLILYWASCMVIAAIGIAIQLVPAGMGLDRDNQFQRSVLGSGANTSYVQWQITQGHYSSPQAYLDSVCPLAPSAEFFQELLLSDKYQRRAEWWARCYLQCVLVISWPLAVVAILMSLRVTMRRAQVRVAHLFRVAIYCNDLIVWIALLALIPTAIWAIKNNPDVEPLSILLMIAITLLQTYRLNAAIALYLRFRHAVATAIAVQLIFFLAAFKVYLMAIGY